jgi:hypothetical protein
MAVPETEERGDPGELEQLQVHGPNGGHAQATAAGLRGPQRLHQHTQPGGVHDVQTVEVAGAR